MPARGNGVGFPSRRSAGEGDRRRTLWHQFSQRRLKAWQPILAPKVLIPLFMVSGVAFIVLGIALLINSVRVVELSCDYTDKETNEHGVGHCDMNIEMDLEAPIWVYYQLEGFFQNHRRYIKSFDPRLLAEASSPETQASNLQACNPAVKAPDGRVLYPCGLVATTVFNDSFVVAKRSVGVGSWARLSINSDAEAITWHGDRSRFHNVDPEGVQDIMVEGQTATSQHQIAMDMWMLDVFPPVECEQQVFNDMMPYVPVKVAATEVVELGSSPVRVPACTGYKTGEPECNFTRAGMPFECAGPDYKLVRRKDWGVESGHFIVWMRVAGLPKFRKLWGRIDEPLIAGTQLRIYFVNNYPTKHIHGRKHFVLTTGSSFGGRSDFLGSGYILVGSCCLIFSTWKLLQCIYCPRPLGDINFLASQSR